MISICIPTYEMHGEGVRLLKRSLSAMVSQTYKDFEVVITDNSDDDAIESICKDQLFRSLSIAYYRNPHKGMAPNTNESIRRAKGDLIKILYMDDYFAHDDAIKDIVENFTGSWLVTACGHDDGSGSLQKIHIPSYNKNIQTKNTIGSPSVLTIRNNDPLFFDETMTWMLDCDYYKRLHDKYGKPVILDKVNVVIGLGAHQTTNHLSDNVKQQEHDYMTKKHK